MVTGISGDRMVDYLLYGAPSEKTRNYFQRELSNFSQVMAPDHWALTNFQNVYNSFYSQDAVDTAQNILRKSSLHFREDILHEVHYDNYKPNLMTRQYIMACPEVWNLRMKGLSNDFDMQYKDTQPDVKDIHWREDYINVMDGILVTTSDEDGYYEHYDREEINILNIYDRLVVLHNWEVVRDIINSGEDPTVI